MGRYDALTVDNKVSYQNALTSKNAMFSEACGQVLTNYSWSETDAQSSKQLVSTNGSISAEKVFFGIDVWAQNKTPFARRRTTYPEDRGGGTYCGIAVEKLSEIGLSAGIFAPAWTFEHFQGQGRAMEKVVWEGASLPRVSCSCGDVSTQHPSCKERHITSTAKEFPVGSESFFYTDFSRGFGRHTKTEADQIYDGMLVHSQLASQSILPSSSRSKLNDDAIEKTPSILSHELEDVAGQTQLVVNVQSHITHDECDTRGHDTWLRLFLLDMSTDTEEILYLNVVFKLLLQAPGASLSFFLRFSNGIRLVPCSQEHGFQYPLRLTDETTTSGRLQEIGIHLRGAYLIDKPTRIMEIQSIRIVGEI